MSVYRTQRMESIMEQLLADAIVRDVEDGDVLITITNVRIDTENDQAFISVVVFPDEKRDAVIKDLNRRAGDFAYALLKKMKVKKIPHIIFL